MTTALYNTPPYIAPQLFSDADAALAQVQAIYRQSVQHLRQALAHFVATGDLPQNVRAFYPQVRIHTGMATHVPRGEALHTYGFVSGPGIHQTTLTAPDLFSDYYRQQFALLLANHGKCLEVGTSQQPIALHFALDPSTLVWNNVARGVERSAWDWLRGVTHGPIDSLHRVVNKLTGSLD